MWNFWGVNDSFLHFHYLIQRVYCTLIPKIFFRPTDCLFDISLKKLWTMTHSLFFLFIKITGTHVHLIAMTRHHFKHQLILKLKLKKKLPKGWILLQLSYKSMFIVFGSSHYNKKSVDNKKIFEWGLFSDKNLNSWIRQKERVFLVLINILLFHC